MGTAAGLAMGCCATTTHHPRASHWKGNKAGGVRVRNARQKSPFVSAHGPTRSPLLGRDSSSRDMGTTKAGCRKKIINYEMTATLKGCLLVREASQRKLLLGPAIGWHVPMRSEARGSKQAAGRRAIIPHAGWSRRATVGLITPNFGDQTSPPEKSYKKI